MTKEAERYTVYAETPDGMQHMLGQFETPHEANRFALDVQYTIDPPIAAEIRALAAPATQLTEDGESREYGLIVSFPDPSASFTNGFEAGGIWEKMRSGDVAEIEIATHTENREVIARMAASEGWDVEAKPCSVEGWDETKLTKTAKVPERSNPHGLRIVPRL